MRALALSLLLSGCCLSVAPDDTTGTGAGVTSTGTGTGGQTSGGQVAGSGTTTGSVDQCTSASLAPTTLDFGNTLINTSSTKSVTLTNGCAGPLNFSVIVGGQDASLFTVDNAPSSVAAGASVKVQITYSPLELETRSIAYLVFATGDGAKATVNLFGEPVGVALVVSPNPCDFGHVPLNTTKVCCVTVTDQANVAVSIKGLVNFATEDGAFAGSSTDDSTPPNPAPIPVTIQGGASAEVCFAFTPPVARQYSGQVTLDTDDPSGTNPVVELTGWGGGP